MKQILFAFLSLIPLACSPNSASKLKAWPTAPKVDFTPAELEALDSEFHKAYDQEFADLGGPMEIKFFKTIPSNLSLATMTGDVHQIAIMGGNLSKKYMTMDSLRLLICHETGHFLGGGPRRHEVDPEEDQLWNVVEGASDYYASLNCMKRILKGQNHEAALKDIAVSPFAMNACAAAFTDTNDALLCQRNMVAAETLINYFAFVKGTEDVKTSFETRDLSIVDKTFAAHPSLQCRLDTYAAGALCAVDPVRLDPNDLSLGTCESEAFSVETHRPRCWFHPEEPLKESPRNPEIIENDKSSSISPSKNLR